MLQSFTQQIDITFPRAMNLRSKRNQLLVPWFNLLPEGVETHLTFRGLIQESLLLPDYFVIIAKRPGIRRMQRDHPTIQKVSPRFRTAAYDFELISCKPNSVQLPQISNERFALAVD